MRKQFHLWIFLGLMSAIPARANADSILFSTNPTPDGAMAMASRPAAGGKTEIEAGDDFFTKSAVQIKSATFTGLVTGASPTLGAVDVELYHVFPLDSNVPPDGRVPSRANSPADNAFDSRDSVAGGLSYSTTTLSSNFTANNSVLNGIEAFPNQTTHGEGAIHGTEVQFTVTFAQPFNLPAGSQDFFVPQVQVNGGEFYWLSSARPIVAPGTPFPAGVTDLQAWIRNEGLQPDWLRVGTDIVGGSQAPKFNGTFALMGNPVPEPSTLALGGTAGLIGIGCWLRQRRRQVAASPA
jgi:hypothetical protein